MESAVFLSGLGALLLLPLFPILRDLRKEARFSFLCSRPTSCRWKVGVGAAGEKYSLGGDGCAASDARESWKMGRKSEDEE